MGVEARKRRDKATDESYRDSRERVNHKVTGRRRDKSKEEAERDAAGGGADKQADRQTAKQCIRRRLAE